MQRFGSGDADAIAMEGRDGPPTEVKPTVVEANNQEKGLSGPEPGSGSGTSAEFLGRDRPGVTQGEKRLTRKLDLHLIPIATTLYLFSFLDRCVCFDCYIYSGNRRVHRVV